MSASIVSISTFVISDFQNPSKRKKYNCLKFSIVDEMAIQGLGKQRIY